MKKDSKLSLVEVSFHFTFQLMSTHWNKTALLSSVDEAVLANLEETTMCNKSAGTCIVLLAWSPFFSKVFKKGIPEYISL